MIANSGEPDFCIWANIFTYDGFRLRLAAVGLCELSDRCTLIQPIHNEHSPTDLLNIA